MSCAHPIDAAMLADYWLGRLPTSDEEAAEEHLFACAECSESLAGVISLAEEIRKLALSGSLHMIVSDTFLERAAAEGLRVRQYAPAAGGSVDCTVGLEDDLLIGRLNADFGHSRRVDLAICDGAGNEQLRMPDVPFRPGEGAVLMQESIVRAKAAPSEVMIARLVEVDEGGSERVLGEYTFNHFRSIPDPPDI